MWDDNGLGVFATHPDGEATYILNGTQSDGVKNDPNVVLTTLMHNHLPALIEAVKSLEEIRDRLGFAHPVTQIAVNALENLK